jgi:WS/DGAT/MGAT family acyltransferase
MAETIFDDRMNDSDALTWTVERDPLLRSTIVSVWVLDRVPDADRLRDKIERTAAAIPRLRQRVVEDPLGVAPPRWQSDAHFELGYHVRRAGAPGRGTLRDVLDLAEPVAMQAFDRDRPLWEMTLVDGLEGGRAAILLKIHHAMSDGVGLVRMTAGLVERSAEPDPEEASRPLRAPDPVPEPWSPIDEAMDAFRYRASRNIEQGRSAAAAVVQGLGRLVRGPRDAIQDAAELAMSAGHLLAPASAPMSPIMCERSLGLRLNTFSRPLAQLKAAGSTVGGTVNDAFVAGIAGGLRIYHAEHGRRVEELRMSMPINLRHGARARQAGNQFAPVRFAVPVGVEDPRARMAEIRSRIAEERAQPSLPALDVIASALNRIPSAAATSAFGAMLKTVDFVTSNVPGPHFPVYLAGARILEMAPFGPPAGAATNITLFSYDGRAQVGVNSDHAAVPDAKFLADCLEQGLDEVIHLV